MLPRVKFIVHKEGHMRTILKTLFVSVLAVLTIHAINMLQVCHTQKQAIKGNASISQSTKDNILKMLNGQSEGWKIVAGFAALSIPLFFIYTRIVPSRSRQISASCEGLKRTCGEERNRRRLLKQGANRVEGKEYTGTSDDAEK